MFYGDEIPKILAVDDSVESLNILEKILNPLNIDLICTTSASEALLKANEHTFALGLVDIKMNNIDGVELFKILRSSESTNYMPIIFLSTITKKNDPVLQQIEAIGGDFIQKPIIPEILRGKIKYLLEMFQSKNKLINQTKECKRIIHKMTKLSANLESEIRDMREIEKHIPNSDLIKQEINKILSRVENEIDLPIKRVANSANLLLETNLEPRQLELTSKIRNICEWLQVANNDILDYPKIRENMIELNMSNFNLEIVLGSSVRILESKAKEKNLKINCNIASNVPHNLRGDENRLKQILKNFCTNAITHTSEGKISISVELQSEEIDRCNLYFEISDSGSGVDIEIQDRLFQSVITNNDSDTQTPPIRGIGLTLVKEFTELMGGNCGVKSNKDRGSTFWFTINLKKQQE